ncbi:MAG: hypothetical protein ACHQHN_03050 [Sphingobacteriales bacterium]
MLFEQAGEFILNKLQNEIPANLCYHNIHHTHDVRAAAEMLGKAEHISADDMKLLLTAACYHDSGFLNVLHEHEAESCRIAKENLPGFGFNDEAIERICGMIMATQIPQLPKNKLEQILADADLDYLGRDDFFNIGDTLYHERGLKDRDEWNMTQLNFMQQHHYFTQTALNLRRPKKQENLEKVKALLR